MMAETARNVLDFNVASTDGAHIRRQLADFIIAEFSEGTGLTSVRPEDDLIKRGIVDSMGVLQIVAFIEQTYGAHVADEEIVVENFRSVASIARLVTQKIKTEA